MSDVALMASTPGARLLLVDDDHAFRVSTAALLREMGYVVSVAASGSDGIGALRAASDAGEAFDAVLLDLRMPGTDGMGVVEALRRWGDTIPIVMISAAGSVDAAVQALHLGADDFLSKPFEPDQLASRVAELLDRRPHSNGQKLDNPGGMIGRSPAMHALYTALRKVGPTDTSVLITGEAGVGKSVAARALHEGSPRRHETFTSVNCGTIPPGQLEADLFGTARANGPRMTRDRAGVFELASGGTVVLDDVTALSIPLQQRLLVLMQDRVVTRIGAARPVGVDTRVVATSRTDLRKAVLAGQFSEELCYHLSVFPLHVPALRDRAADIPLHVVRALAAGATLSALSPIHPGEAGCSPFAMRLLRSFAWPGNVRQLLCVLEAAKIHAGSGRIEAQHLPPEVRAASARAMRADAGVGEPARYRGPDEVISERAAIVCALEATGGVRARAADLLGMGRTTLWRKLKAYGLVDASEEMPGDAGLG